MDRTYRIEGMTCAHCAAAVEKEVGAVAGVSACAVDLATRTAVVHGEGFTDEAVSAAVDEAGYTFAGAV
jgi:copper chaperone CopZ